MHTLPAAEPVVGLTFARSKSATQWTDRRRMTFGEFAAMLSTSPVGTKDGPCYTPAIFTGTQRRQDEAEKISVAVLDSDIGYTLYEIADALEARNWRAVIHSTHSHLSSSTDINADAADSWHHANPDLPIGAYMASRKGLLPRVVRDAKIEQVLEIEGKRYYRIRHDPCPKFRIVLPLLHPWRADDYGSRGEAIAAWKERIGALAASLRLHTDQSCTDTSRLFYMPRRREGAEFLYRHLDGVPCDLFGLSQAEPGGHDASGQPFMVALPARPHVDALPVLLDGGGEFDIRRWYGEYGRRFEITKALKARKPDVFGWRVRGPKYHILCPCGDDHYTGQADRSGTFVVDASCLSGACMPQITAGFLLHCMHAGCQGNDRLDRLGAMLRKGWLTPADLVNPGFLTPERVPGETDAAVAQFVDRLTGKAVST